MAEILTDEEFEKYKNDPMFFKVDRLIATVEKKNKMLKRIS